MVLQSHSNIYCINFYINLMIKHIYIVINMPNPLVIWEQPSGLLKSDLYLFKYFYMKKRGGRGTVMITGSRHGKRKPELPLKHFLESQPRQRHGWDHCGRGTWSQLPILRQTMVSQYATYATLIGLQAYLGDTAGSIPDCHNKTIIAIK